MSAPKRDLEDELNRMAPATDHAKLGTLLEGLITSHNALLAKLDGDTGVNSTDYVSTLKVSTLAERG